MTQDNREQEQSDNTYLIDAESALEMARLLDQDKVLTRGMNGIFSEQEDSDLAGVSHILDVACGPGGWVHEVARQYPHIKVTGIDISKNTINYAKAHARVLNLKNAHFAVMNALKPLDFPDESFDIVNMRTVVGFVPPDQWATYLAECKRVLRSGGIMRLTEGEYGFTNKPAHETFMALLNLAQHRARHSFSPTGHNAGMLPMLRPPLKQIGIQNLQSRSHVIDYSFDMEAHVEGVEDIKYILELIQPLFFATKVITPEEYAKLHEQVLEEIQMEDFSGVTIMLTVWGEKP